MFFIQGRCRAEPATVLDVECRAMFGDEGRRASREVRRETPRRKKQGAAPRLHTQIPTRMGLKSMILKLEIELFLAPGGSREGSGASRAAWRGRLAFSGPFWGPPGASWGCLGPFWGRLGAVLGRLGAVLIPPKGRFVW